MSSPRVYVYNIVLASHIDTTTLADGTYELVPEAEDGPGEAQVNFADAVEKPNPTPEASETNSVQEGKPRSMSLYFKLCNLLLFLSTCAFKLQELIGTLVA